jgi:hypothetical protein
MDTESNDCLICYQEVTEKNRCQLSHCTHIFCLECVTEVIKTSILSGEIPKCPIDMKEIQYIQYWEVRTSSTSQKDISTFCNQIVKEWYVLARVPFFDHVRNVISLVYRAISLLRRKVATINSFRISSLKYSWQELYDKYQFFNNKGFKELFEEDANLQKKIPIEYFDSMNSLLKLFTLNDKIKGETDVLEIIFNNCTLLDHIQFYDKIFYEMRVVCSIILDLLYDVRIRGNQITPSTMNSYNNSITDIIHLYDTLCRQFASTKALCLFVPDIKDIRRYYDESPSLCLICSNLLKSDKFMSLKHCDHNVCISCIDKYMIVNCKCVCKKRKSKGRNRKYNAGSDNSEIAHRVTVCPMQHFIQDGDTKLVSTINRFLETLHKIVKRHFSKRELFMSEVNQIFDDSSKSKKISIKLFKQFISVEAAKETLLNELFISYCDLLDMRYQVTRLCCMNGELMDKYGDLQCYIRPGVIDTIDIVSFSSPGFQFKPPFRKTTFQEPIIFLNKMLDYCIYEITDLLNSFKKEDQPEFAANREIFLNEMKDYLTRFVKQSR